MSRVVAGVVLERHYDVAVGVHIINLEMTQGGFRYNCFGILKMPSDLRGFIEEFIENIQAKNYKDVTWVKDNG